MALTKIRGNQINTATQATVTSLNFLNTTSVLRLPVGPTADQPPTPGVGTLRFNNETDSAEIYVSDADGNGNPGWTSVGGGGGPSLGNDSIIRTNPNTLTENVTIGASVGDEYVNAFSQGPITISSGVTVDIESGAVWNILG